MITIDFDRRENQQYQYLWRTYLTKVPRSATLHGLTPDLVAVLTESDDAQPYRIEGGGLERVTKPSQRTERVALAQELERIGLVVVVEYHPSTGLVGPNGVPVGSEGCSFVWTPYGIKVAQEALGLT